MIHQSATELAEKLQSGAVTAEQLTAACFDRIRETDAEVGAFLHYDESSALTQARAVDERRKRGDALGALAGMPIALKDNICVRSQRATCASRILENYRPPYDAGVVERLKDSDAILIGKTNLDEFAMGSSTENSAFQPTRNPWNRECIPGGSSGGSVAAVAARQVPLALGSDTGGSIRQPASFCGVVGLKPTYGRVSRYGLIAYGSSLDQIGPIGKSVTDAVMLLQAIAGHDHRDSTSVSEPVPDYSVRLNNPVQPLTIGVVREHWGKGLDAETAKLLQEALSVFKGNGAKVEEISLPATESAIATYYLVATAEASGNLARYDGTLYGHRAANHDDLIDMMTKTRGEGFGAEVKRRIMLGTFALSAGYRDAYYVKALKVRRIIKEEHDRAFEKCAVIFGPATPSPAFKIGSVSNPLAMYMQDIYTCTANLTGLPAISMPCGFTVADLPVGFQLTAPAFAEEKLLRVAQMYQSATGWHLRTPSL